MKWDQLELNPRIITAVQRAEVKSFKEILVLSAADLQRRTRLSRSDVQQLQRAVAASYQRHTPVTALQVYRGQCPWLDSGQRLSLSCPVLDALLRGGLPLRGLTELAGPSGAGKTQLALQLCLSVQLPAEHGGLNAGAVYICTEDPFPIRRLMQLISHHAELRADVPDWLLASRSFSDNIYIEHMADLTELQLFLKQRLAVLLSSGRVRLVVVDSVAALFRSEFTAREVIQRSRCLLALAATLHRLSHAHNTPVLCLNQVTDVVDRSDPVACSFGQVCSDVLPALGLFWANQVMVRLMLARLRDNQAVVRGDQTSVLRRLEVVFAPHLPKDSCLTAVWREGVTGVRQTALSLPSGTKECRVSDRQLSHCRLERRSDGCQTDSSLTAVWNEGVTGVRQTALSLPSGSKE